VTWSKSVHNIKYITILYYIPVRKSITILLYVIYICDKEYNYSTVSIIYL